MFVRLAVIANLRRPSLSENPAVIRRPAIAPIIAMLAVKPASPSATPKLLVEYTASVVYKEKCIVAVKSPVAIARIKFLVQSRSCFIIRIEYSVCIEETSDVLYCPVFSL